MLTAIRTMGDGEGGAMSDMANMSCGTPAAYAGMHGNAPTGAASYKGSGSIVTLTAADSIAARPTG